MKKRYPLLVAVLVLFTLSVSAFAQDRPSMPENHDTNPFREIENDNKPDPLMDWIKKNVKKHGILNDGSVSIGFGAKIEAIHKEYGVDFELKSRLIGKKLHPGVAAKILPFHLKLRVATGEKTFHVEEAFVAAVSMLLNDKSRTTKLTVTALAYLLKHYKHGQGRFDNFEIMSMTIKRAFVLKKKWLVLEVKGFAGIGAGFAMKNALMKKREDHLTHSFKGKHNAGLFYRGQGRIGIRIAKIILLEFFGGIDKYTGTVMDTKNKITWDRLTSRAYYGGQITVSARSWLDIKATFQREFYRFSLTSGNNLHFDDDYVNAAYLIVSFPW